MRPSVDCHPLLQQEVMRDPVVCADGHTYERAAITEWLTTSSRSPITNQPLRDTRLIPNYGLKSVVAALHL